MRGFLDTLDFGLKIRVGLSLRGKNGKKTEKKSQKGALFEQKAEKLKKKLQNDSFYCVFL